MEREKKRKGMEKGEGVSMKYEKPVETKKIIKIKFFIV